MKVTWVASLGGKVAVFRSMTSARNALAAHIGKMGKDEMRSVVDHDEAGNPVYVVSHAREVYYLTESRGWLARHGLSTVPTLGWLSAERSWARAS